MTNKTDWYENALVDMLYRHVPAAWGGDGAQDGSGFVGLMTAAPTEASAESYTELYSGVALSASNGTGLSAPYDATPYFGHFGYSRFACDDFFTSAASAGVITMASQITWTNEDSSAWSIRGVGVFDEETRDSTDNGVGTESGHLLIYVAYSTARTVNAGESFVVDSWQHTEQ